ncbi:MAG: hypothetical protein KAH48_07575 [Chlorobi bacterium]|nr:hypothetical protein [Chlorobiota bacterium]
MEFTPLCPNCNTIILSKGPKVCTSINDSKEYGVFIAEYKFHPSIITVDSTQFEIEEAWTEYFWDKTHGPSKCSLHDGAYRANFAFYTVKKDTTTDISYDRYSPYSLNDLHFNKEANEIGCRIIFRSTHHIKDTIFVYLIEHFYEDEKEIHRDTIQTIECVKIIDK